MTKVQISKRGKDRPLTRGRSLGLCENYQPDLIHRIEKQHALVTGKLNGHVIEANDTGVAAAPLPDGTDLAGVAQNVIVVAIASGDTGKRNAEHGALSFGLIGHNFSPYAAGPNHSDPCPANIRRTALSGTARLSGRRPALRAESEGLSLAAKSAADRVHGKGWIGWRLAKELRRFDPVQPSRPTYPPYLTDGRIAA